MDTRALNSRIIPRCSHRSPPADRVKQDLEDYASDIRDIIKLKSEVKLPVNVQKIHLPK